MTTPTIGSKVKIKRTGDKTYTVAKVVRTAYGQAARLVDEDNVYVGQFLINTLIIFVDNA